MRKTIMILFVALMPFVLSAQNEEGIENQEQMVLIPAGEFMMGSDDAETNTACNGNKKAGVPCDKSFFDDEKPKHKVYLDAYYIDKYEVTNAQYKECVNEGKCEKPVAAYYLDKADTTHFDDETLANHPVVYTDWNQADNYCKLAGKRLPTEAEWEKAARGDKGYIWPWGNTFDCKKSCNLASPCEQDAATCLVGGFLSDVSSYGVYDMGGNAWEWVSDWYDENYYKNSPEKNPKGPDNGEYHVVRGGVKVGSKSLPSFYRGAARGTFTADISYNFGGGFRCAKSSE